MRELAITMSGRLRVSFRFLCGINAGIVSVSSRHRWDVNLSGGLHGRHVYDVKFSSIFRDKSAFPRGRRLCLRFDNSLCCSFGGHIYKINLETWKMNERFVSRITK